VTTSNGAQIPQPAGLKFLSRPARSFPSSQATLSSRR